jgi:hypothetical protein
MPVQVRDIHGIEIQPEGKMNRIIASIALAVFFLQVHAVFAGEFIKPTDKRLQYMGRIDFSNPESPTFDWAAVNIQAAIRGQGACFLLEDTLGLNYYNLSVDGKPYKVVKAKTGLNRMEVNALKNANHTLTLSKRTEGFQGPAVFKGLELGEKTALAAPPEPPKRKIEFIGASWENGYGNEGVTHGKCDNLEAVSNADLSYTVVLAKNLNAQYHVTAVSGRGILRWYGDTKTRSDDNMPKDYLRALFSRADSKWDFKSWVPDLVILDLGVNDFSSEPRANDQEFVQGYTAFLERVRSDYPKAEIICFADEGWPNYKDKVLEAIQARTEAGEKRIQFVGHPGFQPKELGCDWHPNTASDQVLAGILEPVVRKTMGWK